MNEVRGVRMLTVQRKQRILELLGSQGQVSVIALSQAWGVSEDTVRRDLRDLAAEGRLLRVHGGALPASPAVESYEHRERISVDVKARLGKAAASLIQRGQVVAIDGGTSNLQLVRSLPRDLPFTAVTHSPVIAAELRGHALVEVLMIGGRLFRHSLVAVGSETTEAVGRLRCDLFFLGATGIHPDTGVTTGDWEEAAVKRAFCRSSAETILMVTPEKWGAASPYQIIPAQELSVLVVEEVTSEEALEPYRRWGVEIVKA